MTPLEATEAFILQELKSLLPRCTATPKRDDYARAYIIELAHPELSETVFLPVGKDGNVRCVDIVIQEALRAFEEWQRKHRHCRAPAP